MKYLKHYETSKSSGLTNDEYKCCYCGTVIHDRIENCKNCGANKYVEAKIKTTQKLKKAKLLLKMGLIK